MTQRAGILASLTMAMLCCGLTAARAESLADIFGAGNDAFFKSDFQSAVAHYERLTDAGVRDADVYFNLGSAHARLGELGAAILCFERAAQLAPGDTEIESALTTARTVLGKRRSEQQGEATVQARRPLVEALVQPYRENTLAVLTLLFDVLLFGLLAMRRGLRDELVRTGLAIGAVGAAILLVVSGSALLLKRGGMTDGKAAIVLHESAELREGPDPRAQVRDTAHEGESARMLQREGAFLRVRTARGQEGWMRAADVGVVAPD